MGALPAPKSMVAGLASDLGAVESDHKREKSKEAIRGIVRPILATSAKPMESP